jgi:hypothetical protein
MVSEDDIRALTALEEAMWRAQTRYDLTFQEQRFAKDFFEFGRSGRTYTREQMVRTDSQPISATLPLDALAFRRLDRDTIQLTYNSHVTYDGLTEHARRSSIWSLIDGQWVMRFHQGTPYTPA